VSRIAGKNRVRFHPQRRIRMFVKSKKRLIAPHDLAPDQADIEIAAEDTTSYLRLCRRSCFHHARKNTTWYLDARMLLASIKTTHCCRAEDFFSGILACPPRRTAETKHFLSRSILFYAVRGELPPSEQSDLAGHQTKIGTIRISVKIFRRGPCSNPCR
jgi:hypothetical protein